MGELHFEYSHNGMLYTNEIVTDTYNNRMSFFKRKINENDVRMYTTYKTSE